MCFWSLIYLACHSVLYHLDFFSSFLLSYVLILHHPLYTNSGPSAHYMSSIPLSLDVSLIHDDLYLSHG
jgi:hypothetical protein